MTPKVRKIAAMEYRFADCILDDNRHSLVRAGQPVAVEPMVFDLLHLLLRSPGALVTRDRMIDEIWQGRIVSDSAITACIAAARRAVGDDGKRQAVIRTVARRGLQLVAEVAGGAAEAPPPAAAASAPAPASPPAPAVQRIRYATDAAGRTLAYTVTGDGPPLLCFPPPLTNDLELEWRSPSLRAYVDRLSARFRYLRFDNAGSGQSAGSEPSYEYSQQADEAATAADAAGFGRFAGISFSGGVLAAIDFAARFPDRLTRLAIVGGYADGRLRRDYRPPGDSLKTMIAEGWDKSDSPFATAFVTSYFPEGPLEAVRSIARVMQAACPPEVMLKDRDALNTASVAHLLGQVRCPTLILHARHDAVHPLSEARKLAAGIRDAELVVLESANHLPLPGNPAWDPALDTLLEFLAG